MFTEQEANSWFRCRMCGCFPEPDSFATAAGLFPMGYNDRVSTAIRYQRNRRLSDHAADLEGRTVLVTVGFSADITEMFLSRRKRSG